MDFWERLTQLQFEKDGEMKARLSSEVIDYDNEKSRLVGMMQSLKDLPPLPDGITYEAVAAMWIDDIATTLRNAVVEKLATVETKNGAPITFNINQPVMVNSPYATQSVTIEKPKRARSPKKKHKQTICFRFIKDDLLDLNDRVIFSYLCRCKKLGVAADVRRIRNYTRYRPDTIKVSLVNLLIGGYIDRDCNPLKTFKGKLVRRDGDDRNIVRAIVEINRQSGRTIRAGWAMKAFGISRATYFRAMAASSQ